MKILSFGEILWDEFISPEGDVTHKEIGGAPFNFAAHCAKNGAESYIITAVGDDKNGKDALAEVKRLGVHTDYITTLPQYPTGACRVSLRDGIPSYDLLTEVAYDHIPQPQITTPVDALYMGTLAMRGEESLNSFRGLLSALSPKEILFDINLRGDFYSKESVDFLLSHATIFKMSDEEMGFFGDDNRQNICEALSDRFPNLKYVCVTLGKDGAFVADCRAKRFYFSEKPKSQVVSTVGAGDSFAAAFLVGVLSNLSPEESLKRGVALSDFVVTQRGAVPDYDPKALYKGL